MIDIRNASHAELDQLVEEIDAGQGERVLNQVYDFLGRFVSYPSDEARIAHTAWIVHAHAMNLWESTPRIAFLSPEPGSGKSRALEITETLVPRPLMVMNVSAAYLFRKVTDENGLPTVLLDEVDTMFGPAAREHEDVRGWLNAGHRQGAMAGRCVNNGKKVETEDFPAYCAVAVAGLGKLPDTIMSRSVIIRMRRRHAGEQVEPFRHRIHAKQALPIRLAIEAWAKSLPEIEIWPDLPSQIQDRDADVWEALVAIGDMAGGNWGTRIRHAAVTLVTAAKESEPSRGVRLLSDLRDVFGDAEQMQTNVILEKLVALEESPWADMRGKPLDSRRLSTLLKDYEIKPRQLWFGPKQLRGYAATDFKEAWLRYLRDGVTSVTSVTTASVTDVTDVTRPQGERQGGLTVVDFDRGKCAHCGDRGVLVEVYTGGAGVHIHRACIDGWVAAHDTAESTQ